MWVYWIDNINNNEVMQKIQKKKELLLNMKKRQIKYLDHIIRGERYTIPTIHYARKDPPKQIKRSSQNFMVKRS